MMPQPTNSEDAAVLFSGAETHVAQDGGVSSGETVPVWRFLDLGWMDRIIPCCPATEVPNIDVKGLGKVPAILQAGRVLPFAKWQDARADRAQIEVWSTWRYNGTPFNFGMQTRGLLIVDCDIDDPDACRAIVEAMRVAFGLKPSVRTRPHSSRFAAVYRTVAPMKKRVIRTAFGKVELLSDGQQVVISGAHYASGQPIVWLTPPQTFEDTPLVNIDQVHLFEKLVREKLSVPENTALSVRGTEIDSSILGCNIQCGGWFDGLTQEQQILELRGMLDRLPAKYCADGELWLRVSMALQSAGSWTRGLWDEWSQRAPEKYDQTANSKRWESFGSTGGITVGSLIKFAESHGYVSPVADADQQLVESIKSQRGPSMRIAWMRDIAINPPVAVWMIDDVVPDQGTVAAVAKSNAGKTLWLIHLAVSVATGRTFFGRQPARTGPVIYVAAESPLSVKNRLRAYCLRYGIDPGVLPIAVVDSANIRNDAAVLEICSVIEAAIVGEGLADPVLVIFDTLRRVVPDAEENSSTEMDAALQRLQAVAARFGAAAVLSHHYGKDEARGARGTTALRASFDVEIAIKKEEKRIEVEWSIAKSRDGLDTAKGHFRVEVVNLPPAGNQLAPTDWPVLVEISLSQTNHFQCALDKALKGCQKAQREVFEATRQLASAGPISFDVWVDGIIKPRYPRNQKPKDRGRELLTALKGRGLLSEDGGQIDLAPWVREGSGGDADGKTDSA